MDEEDKQEIIKHIHVLKENNFKVSKGSNHQRINDYFNEIMIEKGMVNQNKLIREHSNLSQKN